METGPQPQKETPQRDGITHYPITFFPFHSTRHLQTTYSRHCLQLIWFIGLVETKYSLLHPPLCSPWRQTPLTWFSRISPHSHQCLLTFPKFQSEGSKGPKRTPRNHCHGCGRPKSPRRTRRLNVKLDSHVARSLVWTWQWDSLTTSQEMVLLWLENTMHSLSSFLPFRFQSRCFF